MFGYHQNCCFIKSGVTPVLNLKYFCKIDETFTQIINSRRTLKLTYSIVGILASALCCFFAIFLGLLYNRFSVWVMICICGLGLILLLVCSGIYRLHLMYSAKKYRSLLENKLKYKNLPLQTDMYTLQGINEKSASTNDLNINELEGDQSEGDQSEGDPYTLE